MTVLPFDLAMAQSMAWIRLLVTLLIPLNGTFSSSNPPVTCVYGVGPEDLKCLEFRLLVQ